MSWSCWELSLFVDAPGEGVQQARVLLLGCCLCTICWSDFMFSPVVCFCLCELNSICPVQLKYTTPTHNIDMLSEFLPAAQLRCRLLAGAVLLYDGVEGRATNGVRASAASLAADISNRSSYSNPATV